MFFLLIGLDGDFDIGYHVGEKRLTDMHCPQVDCCKRQRCHDFLNGEYGYRSEYVRLA